MSSTELNSLKSNRNREERDGAKSGTASKIWEFRTMEA